MRFAIAAVVALAAEPAHAFDPIDFFRGRTSGEGTLKVLFQPAKRITVQSLGTEQKDGSLILRQVIKEPSKPPRTRYWRMRQTGPNRFEGTLSDATGPVRVTVDKGAVRIRYRTKDNLDYDQHLTPAGPRTVNNRLRVRRFGVTVARVEEVIRKLD
jgi:hypothetical protein